MFEGLVLITPEEINSQISQYCNDFDRELIKKAYIFALTRHGTQLRESGDPYFSHPLEVTKILIELKMDQETIVAGMLHDILEDTATTMDELSEQFGQKIASIVNGVTKLTKFEGISIAENQIANFRKLLISAASDIRVLIIKLADRLHNMRTLAYKKKRAKRQSIARETLEIYAPLAERIGLAKIKEELQDIAFHELHPDIYNTLKSKLNEHIASTENEINIIFEKLLELSQSIDPNCAVSGRIKSPYSIWKKLTLRNMSLEQLSDIIAFRVIVDTIPQCY
ncbi:MAG: bifunctional (p)ppGpp synthetase/guanosine-3',5'-bis(diphosphate) 3'-pyrophosphohydrolase, partial [Alphaproteobacteria bacterium]|nr:bifunctional (p)ppGpp synthetase/guanosine-3',5'-bis(diphosphate) 3'-pyrophosphohydrolase [Alphaproteobacteria bacterium]